MIAPGARGLPARLFAGLCVAMFVAAGAAEAQIVSSSPVAGFEAPAELNGVLKKARDTGSLSLGHRQSSIPFAYLSPGGLPIGYSVDLCKLVVDAVSEAVGRQITVQWQPVTSESRFAAVVSGAVDLECGSTTSNVERQKTVAFSPTIFVAGTKLLVPKGSAIKSFRDLAGKRVVVTAGTTNEKVMRDLGQKFKLEFNLLVANDHAASFAMLAGGQVDAFALDDVLLSGLLAQNKAQGDFRVTGEFLSYEPYGLMFRKGDPQFAALVDDAFRHLSDERELERRYERWFMRRLPSGDSMNLPMSPQLDAMFRALSPRPE